MSEDLTPRQQILLWDLVSRGGSAMQKDVKPDVKPADREHLKQSGFIFVSSGKNKAFILSLNEEKAWGRLGRASAGLLATSKGSIYDRPVLQFVIERMQRFSDNNGLALSEVFAGKRVVGRGGASSDNDRPHDYHSIEKEIASAFSSIAGRPAANQVRLRALRERLPHISRADLDKVLVDMRESHKASFSTLSNPPDIAEQGDAGLTIRDQTFHTIWIEA